MLIPEANEPSNSFLVALMNLNRAQTMLTIYDCKDCKLELRYGRYLVQVERGCMEKANWAAALQLTVIIKPIAVTRPAFGMAIRKFHPQGSQASQAQAEEV